MPQEQRYLTTDPDAGNARYLSTDPDAGEPLRVNSRAQKVAADMAPTAGGMIGGAVGGVPGALIGGAAGKGYGDLIEHAGEIPGALWDVARNMFSEPTATIQGLHQGIAEGARDTAIASGIEGASQVAGNAIAKGGGLMAKWLMNRATSRASERLLREFPDLSDTLIDNALTVSKGGYDKAKAMLSVAKGKANAALKVADESGNVVPVQFTEDIAESFKTALLEDAIRTRGIPVSDGAVMTARNRLPDHLRATFKQIDEAVASGQPMPLKPSMADLLKRRVQKESKNVYANRTAPNGPRAVSMSADELTEFAARLNDKIDAVSLGYKAANAEAQPLIGATRGIKQAIRPNAAIYQAMVRPAVGGAIGAATGSQSDLPGGAAIGALTGAAMSSPAGMSRQAILLADPNVQAALRQLPRATALALEQLLRERSANPIPDSLIQARGPQ